MTAVVILLSAAVGHAVAADAVLLAARHALVAASARTNETFPAEADEILTVRLFERGNDDRALVRSAPLQQRTLHRLVLGRFCHENRLHGARINLGVVHRGGQRTRRGIKILHLLGHVADAVEVLREHDGVIKRCTRMRAHQIGHKILLAAQLFVDAGIPLAELLVHLEGRLAHVVQGVVAHVLRRDLQLTGDVVLDQFAEERIVLLGHHVVVAQTGAHEHLLHALDAAQLTQQFEVIRVVCFDVLAGGWEQTALVLAAAVFLLLFAGRKAEIRGRAADIVDVSLESGHLGDLFCFLDHALVTAHLNVASLMERERAEVARAEAAAVVDDGELHLLNGGYAAERFVGRMISSHIRQRVNMVHLFGGQWLCGRVLHKDALAVPLENRLAAHGILFVVLDFDRTGVVRLAGADILVRGTFDRIILQIVRIMHHIGRAADSLARVCALFAVLEVVCQLNDRVLAHAEHHAVRAGGFQNGRHNTVSPVIVVCKSAQTGFNAAEIDRRFREGAPRKHGIDGYRTVRALAAHTARRVRIVRTALFRRGVVRDHRVDVAAVDEHRIARTAHFEKIVLIAEIRLAEDSDLVACILQHA